MKPACIIGIDGGGTKTSVMLADRSGTILAEESGGPSNFQIIGLEPASKTIASLVLRCCVKAGKQPGEVKSLVAGLTGAGRRGDQERMKESLSSRLSSDGIRPEVVSVESDARIALEGAFKGSAGIILIAGTGSIAFGKTAEGIVLRVGGWGRTIGDEGGGYSIGRDGLNIVSRYLDGRGKPTHLADLLAERFGLKDQESIIAAVYRDNFDVASMAPLVVEAAAQHDTESERILNRAAFELTEHVRALTFKLEDASPGPRQKLPLAFIGSILTQENLLTKILKHKIEFSIPQITVVKPQASPAFGAVLMATRALENERS